MKSLTDKKVILRCFFTTGLFCLHEKFQVYQSSYSRFVKKMPNILSYLRKQYFSTKIFTVLHQSKKELLDLDQNWAKTRHLLFKTWKSSISMDSTIVHWGTVESKMAIFILTWEEVRSKKGSSPFSLDPGEPEVRSMGHRQAALLVVSCV